MDAGGRIMIFCNRCCIWCAPFSWNFTASVVENDTVQNLHINRQLFSSCAVVGCVFGFLCSTEQCCSNATCLNYCFDYADLCNNHIIRITYLQRKQFSTVLTEIICTFVTMFSKFVFDCLRYGDKDFATPFTLDQIGLMIFGWNRWWQQCCNLFPFTVFPGIDGTRLNGIESVLEFKSTQITWNVQSFGRAPQISLRIEHTGRPLHCRQ